MDTPLFAFQVLICQWFYAISVALPFGAQNFSHSMKIGTYKKKTLKIDPQVLKISYVVNRSRCVDAGFKADQAKLDQYLSYLEKIDPETLSRNEQFAFYINAYTDL